MQDDSRYRPGFLFHLMIWVGLFVVGMAVFGLYFPWQIVVMHAFCNIALLAMLFYASAFLTLRFSESGAWMQFILLQTALYVIVSVPRSRVNLYLARQVVKQSEEALPFSLFWRVTALVMATSAFILALGAAYALLRARARQEQRTRLLIAERQEAELHFLKAQINPHFLFNALHNLYTLTELKSPEAPKMLLQLSNLLRYVIYDGRQKAVLLNDEMQHIHHFIALYEMRFEHPVDIRVETSGEWHSVCIEPMILIPLIENCFKHADFDTNVAARAVIRLHYHQGQLEFETENTFQETDLQKDGTGGVGLENIVRRLSLRYPQRHHFEYRAESGIFKTRLSLHPDPCAA